MSSYPALRHQTACLIPSDVATHETVEFLSSYLAPGSEVIEVGCGEGEVALELSKRGYEVLGLDSDPNRVTNAKELGVNVLTATWPNVDFHPVDGIAFTRSLHHIDDLLAAVEKTRALLKLDGTLLVEDFAFDAADKKTIDWLVKEARSTEAGRLLDPKPGSLITDLLSAHEPFEVWHAHHDASLHSITAITDAIAQFFTIIQKEEVPYLYRYFIPALPKKREAVAFVSHVLQEETRLAKEGEIQFIGRRIVARRNAYGWPV